MNERERKEGEGGWKKAEAKRNYDGKRTDERTKMVQCNEKKSA